MVKIPIADLHCDLLWYLAKEQRRSPWDAVARCSFPQMQQGGVQLQILPIFTETKTGSSQQGKRQAEAYFQLFANHPLSFAQVEKACDLSPPENKIALMLAIENASGFFEEQEPLAIGFKRLHQLHKKAGHLVYLSPTWNQSNRFGGGAHTEIGLRNDGKELLHFLHQRKIAYDCSHNSDLLLTETLTYMDAHQLDIPILASHSNMRAVFSAPRNLPDALAKEILQRGGIFGINFYKPFLGPEKTALRDHLAHLLHLGAKHQVCFGADFFHEGDFPQHLQKPFEEMFFQDISDSSCYQEVLNFWQKELQLATMSLENIANHNLKRFLVKFSL